MSTGHKFSYYYEDNIDSETEVFIDPQFESRLALPTETKDEARNRKKDLFQAETFQKEDVPKPRQSKRNGPGDIDDHFNQIDGVINSNYDDQTKQRIISEIQDKYRSSQGQGRTEPNKMYKPRSQKKYKDQEEDGLEKPNRAINKTFQNQDGIEMQPHHNMMIHGNGSKTAKLIQKHQRKPNRGKDANQIHHQQYLMPEINELIGEQVEKRDYLTQDEMGDPRVLSDSRHAQTGGKRKRRKQREARNDSMDEGVTGQNTSKNFTPGRIRASRMRTNLNITEYAGRKDNYIKSPANLETEMFTNRLSQHRDNKKISGHQPHIEQVDHHSQSMMSVEDSNKYLEILPAVKVKPKRKKRSPSSQSNQNNSIGHPHGHSASRMSSHNGPKLRETLDQNLHYIAASVKVPLKQTHFYDEKHDSGVTQQQMQTWKIKNGAVIVDSFDVGKKIPPNRHRIPDVGGGQNMIGNAANGKQNKKSKSPPNGPFIWDMDGRRHSKPKKKTERTVITSNATVFKVGLPGITKSIGKKADKVVKNSQSFGKKSEKFIDGGKFVGLSPNNSNGNSDVLVNLDVPIRGPSIGPSSAPKQNSPYEPKIITSSEPGKRNLLFTKTGSTDKISIEAGVVVPPEIDPRGYINLVEKQRKKLQKKTSGKVVVEDDFVEPSDFRDPGGRKNQPTLPNELSPPKKNSLARNNSNPSKKSKKSKNKNSQKSKKSKSPLRSQSGTKSREPSNDHVQNQNQINIMQVTTELGSRPRSTSQRKSTREPNSPILRGTIESSAANLPPAYQSKTPQSGSPNQKSRSILRSRQADTVNYEITDALHVNGRFNIDSRGQDRKTELGPEYADKRSGNQIELSSLDKGSMPGPYPAGFRDRENEGPDYEYQAVRTPNINGLSSKNIPIDLHLQAKTQSSYTASNGQVRFMHKNNLAGKDFNSEKVLERTQINEEYNQDHSRQQYKNYGSMDIAAVRQMSLPDKQEIGYDKTDDLPEKKQKKSKNKSSNNVGSAQTHKSIQRTNTGQFTVGSKALGAKRNSSNSRSNKSHSHSPEVKRVMESLTHHRVKIDSGTKLLINGTEILTHQGIKGNIHKVGVGFGTGRHTSGRRLDLLKEVPFVASKTQQVFVKADPRSINPEPRTPKRAATPPSPESPLPEPQYTPSIIVKEPSHRIPIRFDAQTQHLQETQSAGCEPYQLEMRSERIQAQVSQHDINLSARTMTAPPEKDSVAVSARPISACSMREQCDQVTEGRFEPIMVHTQMNTDGKLFKEFLKKEMKEMNVGTDPIIFGEPTPQTCTIMIQTDPVVQEYNTPDEPKLLTLAYEPVTLAKNFETGSNGSLLDVPLVEEMFELILPPPQEPEEPEPITDDWAYSRLYQYVYQSHFDKMVKKRLISTTIVQRPSTAKSQEGMTAHQRFENNLNPDNRTILSQIECEYGQQALKHKSANYRDQSTLQDLYTRAVTTIEVLVANMVRPDICNAILFAHYKEVTKKNVIKLLLRVKRLYEARNESVNILKLVMEVEAHIQPKSDLWRIIQDNTRSRLPTPFHDFLKHTLKNLSNCLTRITIFQQEHHLFNNEFKFNQKEYRDYIRDIGRIIGGFLQMKEEVNPALQETGLLLEEHSENAEQTDRYNQWVAVSLKDFGRMDLPTESDIEQTLQAEMPKEKGRKIDDAVQKMREAQREKSEKDSHAFDLSSKSRILEQMQLKANKLENLQQDYTDEWPKTVISDQMLDRIQESAQKRKRLAQRAQEREERRARGESDNDDYLEVPDKKMFGKALLLQQMQYDNDMEYNKTENMNDHSQKGHLRVSSAFANSAEVLNDDISDITHQHFLKKAEILITPRRQFAQFQQINIGKYAFDSASEAPQSEAQIGEVYEQPKIMIPNMRLSQRHKLGEHSKSVQGLNLDSPRKQQILDNTPQFIADDKSEQFNHQVYGADLQSNSVTPSECTVQPYRANVAANPMKIQDDLPPQNLSELDEMTEFTEQQDFVSHRIARERAHSPENIYNVSGVHLSDIDQTELGNQDNYYIDNSRLNVLIQGSIKIKYQQSAHQKTETPTQQRTITGTAQYDRLLNDSEAASQRDSFNDRSQQ